MASPRATINPVSSLTFHSLMCLHLEAVLLQGERAAASREQDKEHSRPLRPRAIRQRRLPGALIALLGLLFMSSLPVDGAVHVRQHSRECPGYLWRCNTGYRDYAAQHRSEYGPRGEDQRHGGLCV